MIVNKNISPNLLQLSCIFGKYTVQNDHKQIQNSSYFLMIPKMDSDNRGYTGIK